MDVAAQAICRAADMTVRTETPRGRLRTAGGIRTRTRGGDRGGDATEGSKDGSGGGGTGVGDGVGTGGGGDGGTGGGGDGDAAEVRPAKAHGLIASQ